MKEQISMRAENETMPEFNRRAATYAENASVQRREAVRLGEWLVPAASDEKMAVELGAGTGFFTRELLKKGYRVLATDIAPEMVVRGRRNCPEAEWVIHDGWRLPPTVADLLVSSSLLQWMPEPEKTLRVLRAALRPGGKMLHGFFVAPSLRELYSLVGEKTMPVEWRTAEEWRAIFAQSGLRILRSDASTAREIYPDVHTFLRVLHATGTTLRERRFSAGTLRKIMREYAENFSDERGGVFATWSFLRVEAECA